MKYKVEFDANESFQKGYCYECPLGCIDHDNDCDVHCTLYARYDKCPLEDVIIEDKNMHRDINNDMNRLLAIKVQIDSFNKMKSLYQKTVAISNAKYTDLRITQSIDKDTLYCIFDNEIGQYIDGYIE